MNKKEMLLAKTIGRRNDLMAGTIAVSVPDFNEDGSPADDMVYHLRKPTIQMRDDIQEVSTDEEGFTDYTHQKIWAIIKMVVVNENGTWERLYDDDMFASFQEHVDLEDEWFKILSDEAFELLYPGAKERREKMKEKATELLEEKPEEIVKKLSKKK